MKINIVFILLINWLLKKINFISFSIKFFRRFLIIEFRDSLNQNLLGNINIVNISIIQLNWNNRVVEGSNEENRLVNIFFQKIDLILKCIIKNLRLKVNLIRSMEIFVE